MHEWERANPHPDYGNYRSPEWEQWGAQCKSERQRVGYDDNASERITYELVETDEVPGSASEC